MKKIVLLFIITLCSGTTFAQEVHWTLDPLNVPGNTEANLGTASDDDLNFFTNDTNRMVLTKHGNLKLLGMVSSVQEDRVLIVGADGQLKPAGVTGGNECGGTMPWMLGGNTVVSNTTGIFNHIGTCNYYDFILKSNGNPWIWIKTNGKVGIGENSPSAKFEVFESSASISSIGDYKLITSIKGNIGHDFHLNNWLYRPDYYGGDWREAAWQDGITTNTTYPDPYFSRSWWQRLPGQGVQKWGDVDSSYMILKQNQLIINEQNGATNASTLTVNVNGGNAFEIFDKASNSGAGRVNFRVKANGATYIGAQIPKTTGSHANALLSVDGKILAKEIFVNIHNSNWADYVFENNYKLKPLSEIENFIKENKHLPNVPSAKELTETNDFNLSISDMQKIQMEKIEELYLYIIRQQKEIEQLKKENKEIKK